MVTQPKVSGAQDLVRRIVSECDDVIDAEISRLRRRRPTLSDSELAAAKEALTALADRLLLSPLRDKPGLHDSVAPIFAPHNSGIWKENHD